MILLLNNQTNQTINASVLDNGGVEKSQDLETFKMVFVSLVAFLGVVGNIAVCVVITRNKKTKSSTELLIRNLAVADLGVLLVVFPLTIMRKTLPFSWPLGKDFCLYVFPISELFYGVSVWNIVVIAVERYRHLACPIQRDRRKVKRCVKRLIVTLWIGCFLIFVAPLFYWMEYTVVPGKTVCYLALPTDLMTTYVIFLLIIWYCVPVIIIVLTYIAISREINRSNVFLKSMSISSPRPLPHKAEPRKNRYSLMQQRRLQQNRRVKKILTPVVVAFVVTMLPVNAFRLIIVYHQHIIHNKLYPLMIYINLLCVILNSAINPLIYSFVSPGFRAGVRAFVKNRSIRVSIVAESALRAVGKRMTFTIRQRRMYSFNSKSIVEMRSMRSAQTPVASMN
ncbi:hypothetical protein QZH41_004871 [Actinostola sp. cb2023]|nr:hypothetical protein QZH41_004871 [Actinostola sp. cb2023]